MQSNPKKIRTTIFLLFLIGTFINITAQSLVVSTDTIKLSEGAFGTFTVSLDTTDTAPLEGETVVITHSFENTTRFSVSPDNVQFTKSNIGPSDITISVNDNNWVDGNDTIPILLYQDEVYTSTIILTITDNESADFTITPTSSSINEGSSDQLAVVLSSQPAPDETVVIDFTSSDPNAASVNPASATFNNGNWSTPQYVEVTAVQDVDAYNESITISANVNNSSSSSSPFHDLSKTTGYSIADDETADLNISASSLIIDEEATVAFTISLSAQPTNDVIINLTSDNTDAATVSPASLTFNNSNWSTARTVYVSGVTDTNLNDETAIITASVDSNSDTGFTGISDQTVDISITDNDVADFTINPNPLGISEGSNGTFEVVLTAQPTNDVVITLTNNNSTSATIETETLTFTSDNWNTPVSISISALEDDDPYNELVTVTIEVDNASSDSDFNDISKSLTVNITDNENADFVVSSSNITVEESSTNTFTLELNSQPTDDVTINLSSNNSNAATVSPSSVTFSNSNWNSPVTITITGVSDANLEDESAIITASIASGSDNAFLTAADKEINATVTDNDIAAIILDTESLALTENQSGTFDISLSAEPSSDVVVSLISSDQGAATVSNETIVFTDQNWNIPVTVTINALSDSDVEDESMNININVVDASSDDHFDNLSRTISVAITDINTADFNVSDSDITITEGTTGEFSVSLTAQPVNPVTINLSNNNTNAVSLSTTTVDFNSTNWNTPQTITISALHDDNLTNESATITASVDSGSDLSFTSITSKEIDVTVDDDDEAGFTVSPNPLSITEESSGNFTVVLTAQPESNVVIDLSNTNTNAADLNLDPLIFTPSDWDQIQTITITGVDDADADDETATINLEVDNGESDASFSNLSQALIVNITDNESANFVLSSSTINITEGNNNSFTIELTSQPTIDVTIELTSSNTDAISLSESVVTFTNSSWDQAQTILITALEDDNIISEEIAITASVSSDSDVGYTGLLDKTLDVAITDNDIAGIIILPATLNITEGDTQEHSFSVALAAQPSSDVIINLSNSDSGAATISENTLTFTPTNWSAAQPIVVSPLSDDDSYNEAITITASVDNDNSDSDFSDISESLTVNITDNDIAEFVLSSTELNIDEDSFGTFTVVLSAQPNTPVTINLSGSNANIATVSPSSLQFTNQNWSTPQTVTITGISDNNLTNETSIITASVDEESDPAYIDLANQTVDVTITDVTIADFSVSTSNLTVNEGSSGSFTVVLLARPASNVVINVSNSNAGAATISSNTLTFTPTNWSTPQQLNVVGVQDDDSNNETATITLSINTANSDVNFANIENKTVGITIQDIDTADFNLSVSEVFINEGTQIIFTVSLTSQPITPVIINLANDNSDAISISANSLTFNSDNWNTSQPVTISALQDDNLTNEGAIITASVDSESDASFVNIENKQINITVIDTDEAGFSATPNPIGITEGNTGTISVVLTQQPSSNVIVNLANSNSAAASFDLTPLEFTSSNWNTPQPILVTGVEDADADDEVVTLTLTIDNSSDTDFIGLNQSLTINITDNETANFVLSASEIIITEGSSEDFTIVLSSQPNNDVTIDLTSNNNDAISLSESTISFTSITWNQAQTITVSGLEDNNVVSESVMITASVSSGSDSRYITLDDKTIAVTVNDNDNAGIITSLESLDITEGDTEEHSFTISLAAEPSSNVFIDITSSDEGAATVSSSRISFNTNNWNTPQTIVVSPINDDDAYNETVTIDIMVDNESSDANFINISESVTVDITDNDAAGFTLSETELNFDENSSDTFTVVLTAQPINNVTINLSGAVANIATLSRSNLQFTAQNWETPQTVTISGVTDYNLNDESLTITASVTPGSDQSYLNVTDQVVNVNITDITVADFSVSTDNLIVTEGESSSFNIVLSAQPTSNVVINVNNSNTEAATISNNTLTFTPTNWNTEQSITIEGIEDADSNDEAATISLSIDTENSDLNFSEIENKVISVTIEDDENADINLSASELFINEGTEISFAVSITAQPTNPVIINLSNNNTDAISIPTSPLTFTADNWNTSQTVTISALEDDNLTNEIDIITASVDDESDASFINIGSKEINITVIDNDEAGITASPNPLGITEGNTGNFSVVLTAQPSSNVIVNLANNNVGAATIDLTPLVFTPDNWSTLQQIEVTGVEDADADDEIVNLTLMVDNSSDPEFIGLNRSLTINITDNETANFVLSASEIFIDEGTTQDFTIVLSSEPTNSVTIDLTSNNNDAISLSESAISFNSSNWNQPQTVTVSGLEDNNIINELVTITASVTGDSDSRYASLDDKTISVTVTDNDNAAIVISASELEIAEGNTEDSSFTVALSAQPQSNVVVDISNPDEGAVTISESSLTFTTNNWDTPQTVIVYPVNDDDAYNETVTVSLAVNNDNSDTDFTDINTSLTVNITDNDVAGFTLSQTELNFNEDSFESFNVVLNTQPTNTVTINFTGANANIATVSPSSLQFTNQSWDTPHTVTVTGVTDPDLTDESLTITASVTAASDQSYINVNDQLININVSDITVADFTPNTDSFIITEGDSNNFSVVLEAQPESDVIINVSNSNSNAVSISTSSLTFTPANWNIAQQVTIAGLNDEDTNDESATITLSVDVDNSDANFIDIDNKTIAVDIEDNDIAQYILSATQLSITEGNSSSITIELATQPNSPVIFNITSSNTTSSAVPETPVTFNADNWDQPQSIEIAAREDTNFENETLTVTISVNTNSDSNYQVLPNQMVTVNITDNDSAPVFTSTPITSINQDELYNYVVTTSDEDGDTPSLSISNLPNWLEFTDNEDGTGQLQGTPVNDDVANSPYSITIRATDPLTTVEQQFSITVININDAPVIIENQTPYTTAEDVALTIHIADITNDVDGNLNLSTLSVINSPANGSVNINLQNETVEYTPNAGFAGNDQFSLQIADTDGALSNVGFINVTVSNEAPIAVNDVFSIDEDTPTSLNVLENDTDQQNNIIASSVAIVVEPTNGSAEPQTDGTVLYTSAKNYYGTDNFTYEIQDEDGYSSQTTVSITINPVNDAPNLQDDNIETQEDIPATFAILENDSDIDNEVVPSSLQIIDDVQNGTLVINSDYSVTYTPDIDYFGSDSFTYSVEDEEGASDEATVTITINSVNDAPVAVDDNDSGLLSSTIRTNVLANDYDVDSDLNLNSVAIVSQPQNGNAEVETGTGYIIFTPNSNFEGSDFYTYQVCDDEGDCDQATVYLSVSGENAIPQTQSDYVTTEEDRSVNIYPLDNDSSPNSPLDPTSLTIIEDPANGSYSINSGNAQIQYTPDDHYFGDDRMVYQICNEASICAIDTIFITISPINDPPLAQDDYMTVIEGESAELDLTLNDFDYESPESLWVRIASYTPETKGTAVILEDRKTLRFTAAYNCGCSEEIVDYILEDGTGAISGGRVHITIEKAPDNIPEVFSPNGDGIDDYFVIPGIGSEEFANNELYIFNRWGAQIYYMKDYNNTWDGRSTESSLGSDELAEGTYFYVFKLANGRVIKGTVYLKK